MQVTQHKLPLCGMSCEIIMSTPRLLQLNKRRKMFFSRMPGGSKLIPLGANFMVRD